MEAAAARRMRVGVGHVPEVTDEVATFAHQLGAPYVQIWPKYWLEQTPGAGAYWSVEELGEAKRRCDERGLVLEAVAAHNYIRAMLGLPGRDEQIEQCMTTIRNMGRFGVHVLDYFWGPNGGWRTSFTDELRPGATTNSFDLSIVEANDAILRHRLWGAGGMEYAYQQVFEFPEDVIVDDDHLWGTYEYFLRAVLPVAEEAGVLLAVHPADPPVPMLGGIARILRSPAEFRRAMEFANSPAFGLLLCQGTVSEMPGGAANVFELIDMFGPSGRIGLIHFRDVEGSVPRFRETFIGAGNYDPVAVMRRLHEVGYTGLIIEDHYPVLAGDTPYAPGRLSGLRGRAHAMGYLQGLLRATDPAATSAPATAAGGA